MALLPGNGLGTSTLLPGTPSPLGQLSGWKNKQTHFSQKAGADLGNLFRGVKICKGVCGGGRGSLLSPVASMLMRSSTGGSVAWKRIGNFHTPPWDAFTSRTTE